MCKCNSSKLFIFPEPEIHSGAPDVTRRSVLPRARPSYSAVRECVRERERVRERFCMPARSAAHTQHQHHQKERPASSLRALETHSASAAVVLFIVQP